MKGFSWYTPTKIIFGNGVSSQIGDVAKAYGNKAMIVTIPGFQEFDPFRRILDALKKASVETVVYPEVKSEPTIELVKEGTELAKREKVDVIIAAGGGSTIDSGKAIAVMTNHEGSVRDYFITGMKGGDAIRESVIPLIAIPTTAGTGSEVTSGAVILDKKAHIKGLIKSTWGYTFAKVALIDPAKVTAYTGMDALTHTIEGFMSINAQPLSDALALKAMELIGKNLRTVFTNGEDIEARSSLALGATLAGMVIVRVGVGAAHALGMALGGLFGINHGLAVGLVVPYVLRLNLIADLRKSSMVAAALGVNISSMSLREAAGTAVDALKVLLEDIGLNKARLRDFGIKQTDIPVLVKHARTDPCMRTNPRRPLLDEEIAAIYESIL